MQRLCLKISVDDSYYMPYLIKSFFEYMVDFDSSLQLIADPTEHIIILSCVDHDLFNQLKYYISEIQEDCGVVLL